MGRIEFETNQLVEWGLCDIRQHWLGYLIQLQPQIMRLWLVFYYICTSILYLWCLIPPENSSVGKWPWQKSFLAAVSKHTTLAWSIFLTFPWVLSQIYSLTFSSQDASSHLLTLFPFISLHYIFCVDLSSCIMSTWPNCFKALCLTHSLTLHPMSFPPSLISHIPHFSISYFMPSSNSSFPQPEF